MQVETFECTETAAEPIEASEEAIAMLEKLGLSGQQSLVGKDERSDRATRCPYREMRKDEMFVYKQLCPTTVKVEDYCQSPIPLRVLQVLEHAKSLGIFDKFSVWDKADSTIKDPVLVATKDTQRVSSGYTFTDTKIYILARWGEVLESWPTLSKLAVAAWKSTKLQKLREIIRKAKADLAETEECDTIPDDASMPHFY